MRRPEVRARRSAVHKAIWQNPELRARASASQKTAWADPERHTRAHVANKAAWQNPERRARQSVNMKRFKLCLDHDHKTDAVRGLLCGRCNQNNVKDDDITWFKAKLAYLEYHAAHPGPYLFSQCDKNKVKEELRQHQTKRCAICGKEEL
jgi:hypothetical protein